MTKLEVQNFEDDEIVFKEGDRDSHMYFLKSGKLRVSKWIDGQEVHLGYVEKGEMVGEISYFDKKPRSASVFTVGRCELAIIPSDKFQKLFDELPSWSQALTKSLVKRVRNNNS